MAFPLDLAGFRASFPEFSGIGDALVQAGLDAAEAQIDEDVWGDQAETGHGYLAAHEITSRAPGREVAKDGTTSYGRAHAALVQRVGAAYRVVLD